MLKKKMTSFMPFFTKNHLDTHINSVVGPLHLFSFLEFLGITEPEKLTHKFPINKFTK
jgi:hypothetical protein